MLTHNIHVKMGAYGIQPSIHAVEGETGRFVNIYTDDRAVTSSLEAELSVHRPDDSYYSIPEVVVIPDSNDSPGYYHLSIAPALTRPGRVECQLKISSNGLVLSTYTFYIVVEPSADGIPVAQLGHNIHDLIEAAESIENIVSDVGVITNDIREALINCLYDVSWVRDKGQNLSTLYDALYKRHNYLKDATRVFLNKSLYTNASEEYYQLQNETGVTTYIVFLPAGRYAIEIYTDLSGEENCSIGDKAFGEFSAGDSEYILSSEIPMTDATTARKTNTTFEVTTELHTASDSSHNFNFDINHYELVFAFAADGYIALPLPDYRGARWVLRDATEDDQ